LLVLHYRFIQDRLRFMLGF